MAQFARLVAGMVLASGLALAAPAAAQQTDDPATLDAELNKLYAERKYEEAILVAQRMLAMAEEAPGSGYPNVAMALTNLADLYRALGRDAEAEPPYVRSLAITEKALGSEHLDVALALNNLALMYENRGRYAEAQPLFKRALAIREKTLAPEHIDVASSLYNLARLDRSLGRYGEAEPLFKRSLSIVEKARGPDHPDVASVINNLAVLYQAQNRYGEAEPLHKRALAIREKALGPDHPDVGQSLSNLASVYQAQGNYSEAEPLYNRSLSIAEKAGGPDHPDVAWELSGLALLYQAQGRYAEAEPLDKRALAIREKTLGEDHPDVGGSLINLASVYRTQSRYAEAEPLLKRALAIREKALGPDHPEVGQSLSQLAGLYEDQGRYAEAEPLFKRNLVIQEKALGPDRPYVATAHNNLAHLYQFQGRYGEAERHHKRALAIREQALGLDHREVGQSLNDLAMLYESQGRDAEAELLYKRSLSISEKALGRDHPSVGQSLNNLAMLYESHQRYAEAEPLYVRSISIAERARGPDHPDVGHSLNNLANLYKDTKRFAEAEQLYKRALASLEKALGADHPSLGTSLNNLAVLYDRQSRYAEAEPLFKRNLVIQEKALGPAHPDVALALNNLAVMYFEQRDWVRAADLWRQSTAVVIRHGDHGAVAGSRSKGKSAFQQNRSWFWRFVRAADRLAPAGHAPEPALADETFRMAQWAGGSEAATSLAQMAARGAGGNPKLAAMVREQQDFVAESQMRDAARSAAVAQSPDKRDNQAEASNMGRLADIETRIGEIDNQLAEEFPDYAALVNPKPLSIVDVQSQLRPAEAVVLFLDTPEWNKTPEETFIWVVTKTDSRWVKSTIGTQALGERVAALRCGLDSSNWTDASAWPDATVEAKQRKETQIARRERCKTLTGAEVADGEPLPFNIAKANELYHALFGEVEDLLRNSDGTFRQLLVVPSGPLTQLPFQVLVAGKPEAARVASYRSAEWLIRRHAVTVLPSVASLRALRQNAKTSRATKPLIGFGNPLLDGNPDKPWQVEAAQRAREKQRCPERMQQVASLVGPGGGVAPLDQKKGVADVAQIRFQAPLPETADELCAVAVDLGVPRDEIRLGSRATEREVKALSSNGLLATYRMLLFSTHGALAGHMKGNAEPGLILTPPETATPEDDGYLSASEIAALKLDADWVILSACDTAAGGADGAEALSGLARAFFYAGARALLVSHWSVYSDATVKLITKAVSTMAADTSIGRSEALRRSMVALIEQGEPQEAQPAFWAPFVVVGEGSAPLELAAANMAQPAPADTSGVVPMVPPPGTPPAPAPAKKKMKRKPAGGDDWITSLFGQ